MRTRLLLTAATLAVAAGGAALAVAHNPALPEQPPPARTAFAPADITRGAELAAVGDCAVCHTAAGGQPYAGGRTIPTPFGNVASTNITPDPANGIGRWSEAAFRRTMRDGVARDGSHLYPVLPYPHFTRATDADIGALYAFLMTRDPAAKPRPPNTLPFPLNQRILLAGWNLLFLRPGPWTPDPLHDADWNRGDYLAEAVGHCGACHTPHNALGAERASDTYAGGQAERWPAHALQLDSPAPRTWTEPALAAYLATGYQPDHGAAAGPMTAVTTQLAGVPPADIDALAHYFASLMPRDASSEPPRQPPPAKPETVAAFTGACGSCHAANAPMTLGGAPSLSLSSSVNAPTPDGVIQVILNGIPWRAGHPGPYMPAFGPLLSDAEIADLADYVRTQYTAKSTWPGLPAQVAKARQEGGS